MSSSPINLQNLNQLFNKHDNNHDGQVNDTQIQAIFQQIGFTDTYIGTIKKVIRLMNHDHLEKETLDFLQLQEFANAKITEGKFKIWKAKYLLYQNIQEIKKQLFGQKEQDQNAAPGASPTPNPKFSDLSNQQGLISVKVGQANHSQHIHLSMQKQNGKQIKPFIKITIQRQTNAQALALQSLFKQAYQSIINIIKAEQQQFINEIMSVSFLTSVNDKTFQLFVTTGNKQIIQLIQLAAQFFDKTLQNHINGKIQFDYNFNFDFHKFVNQQDYSFYDLIVKDAQIQIKWTVWDLFQNLRTIILNTGGFKDLIWSSNRPDLAFLIALLHCQKFTGNVQFQNNKITQHETQSKQEIFTWLSKLRTQLVSLGQQAQIDFIGLIKELDGKINIEAGLKEWRFNLEAQLNGLNLLITQEVLGENNEDD